jgi:hypothetical protein
VKTYMRFAVEFWLALFVLTFLTLLMGCAHPNRITVRINPTTTCHHKENAPDNVVECTMPDNRADPLVRFGR